MFGSAENMNTFFTYLSWVEFVAFSFLITFTFSTQKMIIRILVFLASFTLLGGVYAMLGQLLNLNMLFVNYIILILFQDTEGLSRCVHSDGKASQRCAESHPNNGASMGKGMWAKFFAHIGKGENAAGWRKHSGTDPVVLVNKKKKTFFLLHFTRFFVSLQAKSTNLLKHVKV